MMNQVICYCQNVSKTEIEKAMLDGAKTLKNIQEMTGACTGSQCGDLNPSGKCCSGDIKALLNEKDAPGNPSCCCSK